VWLTAAETHGMDKRPLSAVEILDWLLDLPRRYGKAVFVMFSFKYDIAQLLKGLGYLKVFEIFKHATTNRDKTALQSTLVTHEFIGKNMHFTILTGSISIFAG
jgi:hypothetical protein